MEIDKKNGKIAYNDKEHAYWNVDDNEKYVSVTTLIGRYEQEFDKDFWSAYKSLERLIPADNWKIEKKSLLNTKKFDKGILGVYNISEDEFNKTQQDILDEWQKTNEESCIRGTAVHADLENSMYKMGANCDLKRFGIGGKFICDKGKTSLDVENGVFPEYLISRTSKDGILRIAGQIDLLIKKGNHITIADYKTNREIKQHSGFDTKTRQTVKMKYPLNNLDDCNYNAYTLQLSTYAWMIQQLNPDYVIDELILIHFPHEGGQVIYKLDYLKSEVEKMLRHHKKEKIREIQNSKYKEIEY
jgi:hypothetical protein